MVGSEQEKMQNSTLQIELPEPSGYFVVKTSYKKRLNPRPRLFLRPENHGGAWHWPACLRPLTMMAKK
jgi:hypothetical protein